MSERRRNAQALGVQPIAKIFALVPVVLIAAACIAFALGWRLEGRKPLDMSWRTLTTDSNFSVMAPGIFIVRPETLTFSDGPAQGLNYAVIDRGVMFSVSVAPIPDSDTRPLEQVAASLGAGNIEGLPGVGGKPAFQRDFLQQGRRTQVRVIFQDRIVYQLAATAPTDRFPAADAERFFSSFRVLAKP